MPVEIKNRFTGEVLLVVDAENLIGANLRWVNLLETDLSNIDLRGASLWGAIGNMRELKSAQFDGWPITYTKDVLQIGCQQHPIEKWREWDTPEGREWIAGMDDSALEWAEKYMPLVMQMIDTSPAV